MINRGIIELNAQISTPSFHLIGCEIGVVIGDDVVWNTKTVHNTGYEVYPGLASAVLTGLASIHLVNLSTMNSRYFLLWLPPLRGPTISSRQTAKGQVMGIVCRAVGAYDFGW